MTLLVWAGAVVGLEVAAGFVVFYLLPSWNDRAAFGDSFGAVAALFSGLAFAGLIVALFMQREELELQRGELRATRAEVKSQRLVMERQAAALQRQAEMDFLGIYMDIRGRGGAPRALHGLRDDLDTLAERIAQRLRGEAGAIRQELREWDDAHADLAHRTAEEVEAETKWQLEMQERRRQRETEEQAELAAEVATWADGEAPARPSRGRRLLIAAAAVALLAIVVLLLL